jgi:phage virion morphogenesis protein
MAEDLDPLEQWIGNLVANLDPPQRKKLAMQIATELRRANAQRLKANVDPDGEKFAPRKASRDKLRDRVGKRGRMFQRAATPRFLLKKATPEQASVGFASAAARIMAVHHFGLRDRVSREADAPEASYPARRVLGLPERDRGRIMDLILARLESGA